MWKSVLGGLRAEPDMVSRVRERWMGLPILTCVGLPLRCQVGGARAWSEARCWAPGADCSFLGLILRTAAVRSQHRESSVLGPRVGSWNQELVAHSCPELSCSLRRRAASSCPWGWRAGGWRPTGWFGAPPQHGVQVLASRPALGVPLAHHRGFWRQHRAGLGWRVALGCRLLILGQGLSWT